MQQPRKWWIGLPLLAIVWVAANLVSYSGIEADLRERSMSSIAALPPGMGGQATVKVAGRDIALAGPVPARDAETIHDTVDDLWGVRTVSEAFETPALPVPTNGPAPSEPAPDAPLASHPPATPNPASRPSDEPKVAAAAPVASAPPAPVASPQPPVAQTPKVVAAMPTTSVPSEPPAPAAVPSPPSPSPPEAASQAIKISPYTFKAEKSDGLVHLTGYVPDATTHQAIAAAAKSRFFDDTIEDDLKIGAGAPESFVAAVTAAFPSLARLDHGVLSLSDKDVTITGDAVYAKAADEIKTALTSTAAPGFSIAPTIGVKPAGQALDAKVCESKFADLLDKGHIQFETGSAILSKESTALLDDIVAIVQRCQGTAIEVAGHTDSVGAARSNLDLSKRRAEAVVGYLSSAGIDTSRVTSVGYGEEKPVASNDTAEGRAKNRRIEFQVK